MVFCVGVREGMMGGFSVAARRRGAALRAGWRSGVALLAGKEAPGGRWRSEARGWRMQGERFDGIRSSRGGRSGIPPRAGAIYGTMVNYEEV